MNGRIKADERQVSDSAFLTCFRNGQSAYKKVGEEAANESGRSQGPAAAAAVATGVIHGGTCDARLEPRAGYIDC